MPSLNNVSYNSARVQRAYRINNIETMRLNGRIQLLEKERLHRQRLTNQDIRLISLTLDYIQQCSGHSVEGVNPDEELDDEERREREKGPCFLYGERIVSRKRRRHFRPQSAMDQLSSKPSSDTASAISSLDANVALRPQSSPNRRKPSFITQFRDDESDFGSASERSKSGASTPRFKPEWTEEPPTEVTKILLRAASSGSNRRKSVLDRNTGDMSQDSSSLKKLTRSLRISSHSSGKDKDTAASAVQSPYIPGRGARITDILNDGKAPMSASYWKSHLNQSQGGPVTSSIQRQSIMDSKKAMNDTRLQRVQHRVNNFIAN